MMAVGVLGGVEDAGLGQGQRFAHLRARIGVGRRVSDVPDVVVSTSDPLWRKGGPITLASDRRGVGRR